MFHHLCVAPNLSMPDKANRVYGWSLAQLRFDLQSQQWWAMHITPLSAYKSQFEE